MAFGFARRRRWQLLAAWVAYWVVAAIVKLWTPAQTAWRLTQLPDNHGTISASFENTLLKLTMIENGSTVWSGAIHLQVLALWIVGPPLLLTLLWLWATSRDEAARVGAIEDDRRNALGEGAMWNDAAPIQERVQSRERR
jgi:hypothetical protein